MTQAVLFERVVHLLESIYGDLSLDSPIEDIAQRLITVMGLSHAAATPQAHLNLWDQSDVAMITYGDTLLAPDEQPLHTLLHGRLSCRFD